MENRKLMRSALMLGCTIAFAATLSAQQTLTRQIPSSGTAVFQATPSGDTGTNGPEIDPAFANGDSHDGGSDATGQVSINRTMGNPGHGNAKANGSQKPKSNPQINLGFDGLNFNQQRFADGGNQFSIEPPDQGMCVGNGYVLESTNDVLTVFNTAGTSLLTGPVSLNQFYGYAHAINRTTGADGPSITDPSCLYDGASQRWFHVVLTLDRVGTSSSLSGKNHLDLAVSQTSNPLGNWTLYSIPVQDDGTNGTPNHQCTGGPCLGDYPHIGADANGIYLTTNEFPFFAGGFHGAQIYAISKQALATSAPTISVVQYDTGDANFNSASQLPGFTIWPSTSAGSPATDQGGSEYMLSSLAVFFGFSNQLQMWSLTNTSALASGGAPTLTNTLINTQGYGIPSKARQPGTGTNGVGQAPGGGNIDWPLGQCLNDLTCATTFLLGHADPFVETISKLDGNDSRMQQVFYANGKLWASLGTGIIFGDTPTSPTSVGIAYFVLHPQAGSTPTASIIQQGYVATPELDMTYGTVAVTESGRGVISFTATGPGNYPSVGFASLDAKIGAGDIHLAAAGLGPQDGFSGYKGESGASPRPRWGDYGAAAVDGKSIWFAQEYIAQTCTLAQYEAAPFGRCNNTRGSLGNWGTRVTKVTP